MTGPGPDPLDGRFAPVVTALRIALAVVAAAAVASIALPGRASDTLAVVAIGGLVATPLVRVAWLAQRWVRRGDLRYGLVAVSVLLVVATGAALAR